MLVYSNKQTVTQTRLRVNFFIGKLVADELREKKSVHEADEVAAHAAVMCRRTENKSVRRVSFLPEFVHAVFNHALAEFFAFETAHATADCRSSDPKSFGLDAFLLKRRGNFFQSAIRATVFVRAAVHQ